MLYMMVLLGVEKQICYKVEAEDNASVAMFGTLVVCVATMVADVCTIC